MKKWAVIVGIILMILFLLSLIGAITTGGVGGVPVICFMIIIVVFICGIGLVAYGFSAEDGEAQQQYIQQPPVEPRLPIQKEKRICVDCKRPIPFDANICPYCGHDYRKMAQQPKKNQEELCPFCGKQLQPDWQVCGYCGRKLRSE